MLFRQLEWILAEQEAFKAEVAGTIVEVDQKERGTYLTVMSMIKFSDFTPEITGAPLLGEHPDEVLASLGYDTDAIARMRAEHIVV